MKGTISFEVELNPTIDKRMSKRVARDYLKRIVADMEQTYDLNSVLGCRFINVQIIYPKEIAP